MQWQPTIEPARCSGFLAGLSLSFLYANHGQPPKFSHSKVPTLGGVGQSSLFDAEHSSLFLSVLVGLNHCGAAVPVIDGYKAFDLTEISAERGEMLNSCATGVVNFVLKH